MENINEVGRFLTPEIVQEESQNEFAGIFRDIEETTPWKIVSTFTLQDRKTINKLFKELLKAFMKRKYGAMYLHVDMQGFLIDFNKQYLVSPDKVLAHSLVALQAFQEMDNGIIIEIFENNLEDAKRFMALFEEYDLANFHFYNLDDWSLHRLLINKLLDLSGGKIIFTEEDYYKKDNFDIGVDKFNGTIEIIKKEELPE